MRLVKTRGIVVGQSNAGDADKVITLLTSNLGKISCFVKGARRSKSRLLAGSQFLAYSEFVLFKGLEMYKVNTSDIIHPFYDIRNDVKRLAYAAYLTRLVRDVTRENQPAYRILQLFLNSLYMLSEEEKSYELIGRIFEMRLMVLLGYGPHVSTCTGCVSKSEDTYFSFRASGIKCQECAKGDASAISIMPGTAAALQHIAGADINRLFSFEVSPEVLTELGIINKIYVSEKLDRDYDMTKFVGKF